MTSILGFKVYDAWVSFGGSLSVEVHKYSAPAICEAFGVKPDHSTEDDNVVVVFVNRYDGSYYDPRNVD